jgi:hypothetical protein
METATEETAQDNLPTLIAQVKSIAIVPDYRITSQPEAESAADSLRRVAGLMKRVDAARKAALVEPLQVVARIRTEWSEPEDLLEQATRTLKSAIGAWQTHVQEEARKAQIKAEQEAASARAAEAARQAAAEASARQRAQEAEAAAAAAAAEGDQAAAAKLAEKAAGLAEKADIIASGSAEAIAHVEISAPAAAAAPKFEGVSGRQKWTAEVRDLRRFLASILADEFFDIESIVDIKKGPLNKLADTYKMSLASKYPGAVAKPETVISARSK